MDSGQIKGGDNPAEVYAKMLQTMTRITEPIAYGIAAKYPTVRELAKGLKEEGQGALEDLRKGSNRDGAVTNGKVGKAISRRVHRVFLGKDGGVLDV